MTEADRRREALSARRARTRLGVTALAVGLAVCSLPGQEAPPADPIKVEIDNEHVRVVRVTLGPGAESPKRDFGDRVVVTIPGGPGFALDEVESAVWRPAQSLTASNLTDDPLEAIHVEPRPFAAGATWLLTPADQLDPRTQKVVLENDRVRVVRNRYAAGTRVPVHSHPPRVIVPLTDARVKEAIAGGPPRVVEVKRGEVRYSPAVTHSITNAGSAPMEVLEIEMKVAAPPPEPPPHRFASADGTDLAYVEAGKGDAVVLVHGATGDYRTWEPVVARLSKSFRVVSYSRRYHWPNPVEGDGSDYDVAHHAEDLRALIQSLGLGRVHLIGHSYGGAVAATLARDHPEMIQRLILAEPALDSILSEPASQGDPGERHALAERVDAAIRKDGPEAGLRTFWDWTSGSGSYDKMGAEERSQRLQNAGVLVPLLRSAGTTRFTCDDAAALKPPILIVRGALSQPRFGAVVQKLSQCSAGARVLTIQGAGHSMATDKPDDFVPKAAAFLLAR